MDYTYSRNSNKSSSSVAGFGIVVVIFMLLWALIGIIAFIFSLVCFVRSGTIVEKALGLVLAVLFGPLYFLFYIFNTGYCR